MLELVMVLLSLIDIYKSQTAVNSSRYIYLYRSREMIVFPEKS